MNARNWGVSKKAEDLVGASFVCNTTLKSIEALGAEHLEETLPRYRNSGFTFVSLTVALDETSTHEALLYAARQKRAYQRSEDYIFVESVDDILHAKKSGKLAIGFHFQGTNPLFGEIALVEVFYRLGVRHMVLVFNHKNHVGDGCLERTDAGLSQYGIRLIEEMNRVGVMVDCTHTGYRTSMEAMEVSKSPVTFSHCNAHALRDHQRNIKDDQFIACAKTGGVIGVSGIARFIADPQDASTAAYLRHVIHIADLVGPEHVCIGLDHNYSPSSRHKYYKDNPHLLSKNDPNFPFKWVQPEQLPEIAEGLLKHGYSENHIKGILGENYLRVARQVWR